MKIPKAVRQVKSVVDRVFLSKGRMKKLDGLFEEGMPEELRPALTFLATEELDAGAKQAAAQAEGRRAAIAARGDELVPIWYSPKPGSAGDDASADARPEPGKVMNFTMERVANTGKNKKWGTVLYLLAKGFGSTTAVELGACAGISAMYFSAVPTMKKLITVEGSEALAGIARESVAGRESVTVVNSLFDEAIDTEIPGLGQTIDLAYIDGHHEKVATIHYYKRLASYLKPGAIVLFDDISWSHDMREAWDSVRQEPQFAHAISLSEIGVCVVGDDPQRGDGSPKHWDLESVLGMRKIGDPHGWREEG